MYQPQLAHRDASAVRDKQGLIWYTVFNESFFRRQTNKDKKKDLKQSNNESKINWDPDIFVLR